MNTRFVIVTSNATKIISYLFFTLLVINLMVKIRKQDIDRNIVKFIPNPRVHGNSSAENYEVSLRERMEESISQFGVAHVSSLPPKLYNMAKPVFDVLPDRYLPGYKSSCWRLGPGGDGEKNSLRCLPYFYIAGMPKCGTTDLWDKIVKHPQVAKGLYKEPHWWTRRRLNPGKPFEAYLTDRSSNLVNMFIEDPSNAGRLVVGDGSASTLWDNHKWIDIFSERKEGPEYVTADILHAVQPNAKILVILREPVSRLYSGYLYFNSKTDPEEFHRKVLETLARYRSCTENLSIRACAYTLSIHRRVRILVGLYAVFVRDWLRAYPRDQIYILRVEDWHSGCQEILPKIYEFLEFSRLPDTAITEICETRTKNTNKRKAAKVGKMFNETRAILQDFYSASNRELSELLNDKRFLWQ